MIEAIYRVETDALARPERPLLSNEASDLSPAVVRYVGTTGKTVVLANASQDGQFVRDASIHDRAVKSVLCLPVQQLDDVLDWCRHKQEDDMTLVLVRRLK